MGGAIVAGFILELGGKSMTRPDLSLIIHQRSTKDVPQAVHIELLRPTYMYEHSPRQLLGVDGSVKNVNIQKKHQ